jgi:SAM-dependent methyltransferase
MPRINNDKFYKSALKKHGATAKGLNWHDEYSQVTRFEVILEMIKDDIKGASIIDAGCGFGDFYEFVKDYEVSYTGYDIVAENVKIAQQRTGQKIVLKDILKDPLEEADFYVASGSMNILSRFETFLFIERCFKHSKKGFIFNLPYGKDESKNFNYFLPQEIKHFAKKFNCKISTKSGYLPNDFTILTKVIKYI